MRERGQIQPLPACPVPPEPLRMRHRPSVNPVPWASTTLSRSDRLRAIHACRVKLVDLGIRPASSPTLHAKNALQDITARNKVRHHALRAKRVYSVTRA